MNPEGKSKFQNGIKNPPQDEEANRREARGHRCSGGRRKDARGPPGPPGSALEPRKGKKSRAGAAGRGHRLLESLLLGKGTGASRSPGRGRTATEGTESEKTGVECHQQVHRFLSDQCKVHFHKLYKGQNAYTEFSIGKAYM